MAEKKESKLGPTGETVRANVKRLRADQNLGYAELSRRLEAVGRSIPTLGLRRLESGERRVDVDELVALALVLDVSPNTLLMPTTGDADELVPFLVDGLRAEDLHRWLAGINPLLPSALYGTDLWMNEAIQHQIRALPSWRSGYRLESGELVKAETPISRLDPAAAIKALESELEQLKERVDRGDD